MIAKGDRLCRLQGPSPQYVGDSAPYGDNRNIAPHVKDYVSFPRLYRPGAAKEDDRDDRDDRVDIV
jgi:hypothetical protein